MKLMKKLLLPSVFLFAVFGGSLLLSSSAGASIAGFKAGQIIDDAVMVDANSMSAAEIQNFLNSKVPNCDTNGTQKLDGGFSSAGVPDYNGNGVIQRWEWGKAKYNQTKFTCLRNYSQGGKSAARIIYDAAQEFTISPKVLIVLLQKEQGLVTDTWPLNLQYRSATGYACGDTSACESEYYGFTNQVRWAARMFRAILNDSPTWYTPYELGNNYIQYSPNASCGGSTVYIQNRATQALYNYTPYQPNQAALNAGYGTAPCGAYGNRNFYLYFTDWFGSTRFPQPIGAKLYRQSSTGKIFLVTTNNSGGETRFYIPSPATMNNFGLDSYGTIAASDTTIQNLTDGGTLHNTIRNSSGNVYLVNKGKKHYIPNASLCTAWALACFDGDVTQTLGDTFVSSFLKSGGNLTDVMSYKGDYYKLVNGAKKPFANRDSLEDEGYSTSQAISVHSSNADHPLGELILTTPGVIKFSPKSTIYYFNGTNYYSVSSMDVYNAWKLSAAKPISAPKSTYNTTADVAVEGTLGYWYQGDSGQKYIIDKGNKYALTASQENLWPTATYVQHLDKLASKLTTKRLTQFMRSGIHVYKLMPDLGEKRYVAGMSNYRDLKISRSNTTNLNKALADSIESGPFAFANGRMLKVKGDPAIYVFSEGSLLHIASMAVLNAYKFDTAKLKIYPAAGLDDYQKVGVLSIGKVPGGGIVIPYSNRLISLSPTEVTNYGLSTATAKPIAKELTERAKVVGATKFWRNSDNGRMYYGDGGALHHITSMQKYYELGGRSSHLTSVDTNTLELFALGDPV